MSNYVEKVSSMSLAQILERNKVIREVSQKRESEVKGRTLYVPFIAPALHTDPVAMALSKGAAQAQFFMSIPGFKLAKPISIETPGVVVPPTHGKSNPVVLNPFQCTGVGTVDGLSSRHTVR